MVERVTQKTGTYENWDARFSVTRKRRSVRSRGWRLGVEDG